MNRKSIIIISFFLSLFLSIIIPFLCKTENETISQTIGLIATMLSAFASLFTVYIAILLFEKFTIDEIFLSKSAHLVIDFREKYKKKRLFLSGNGGGIWFNVAEPFQSNYEEIYGENLLFSPEFIDGFEDLFELATNPHFPRKISDKVMKLSFSTIAFDVNQEELNSYYTVTVVGRQNKDLENWGRFNGDNMTIQEFLIILEDIKVEISNWIKDNSIN